MRKFIVLLLCIISSIALVGCVKDENTIIVGATSTPHAEILEFAKPLLEEKGYKLQIEVFSKYQLLNPALVGGDLDANYFQHIPYLNDFNNTENTNLVAVSKIHYEPFGLYGNGITDLSDLSSGTTIFVPNDDSNLTRALLLLVQEGLIEVDSSKNINTGISLLDVTNDNGYELVAVSANTVAAQYKNNSNVLAVINGNYALAANININTALAVEDAEGEAANTYANVIAVRSGSEKDPKILALLEVLTSQEVKDYITSKYSGAVLPM